nr:UDP-glycosyltransferase 76D1-like [Coffea arabica]
MSLETAGVGPAAVDQGAFSVHSILYWEQMQLNWYQQNLGTETAYKDLRKRVELAASSALVKDKSCIAWLEKQPPNSLLYISLGSIACVKEPELTETAWGLANSGIPFIWVLRSDSIDGSQMEDHFPEGVKALLGERGLIVKLLRRRPLSRARLERLHTNESRLGCVMRLLFSEDARLKDLLISPPIIQPPDWNLPFDIMYDASDYAVGAKVIVFSDHAALRYLLVQKDVKSQLIRWILLVQKFDLEIRDKNGAENLVADHLSQVQVGENDLPLREAFPDEYLFSINLSLSWYADIINFLVNGKFPAGWPKAKKDKLRSDAKSYI